MERYSIHDFNRDFPDDDACLDFVVGLIYPHGITCRACGQVRKHHRLSSRKAYSCDYCGTHVYPLAGTVFEKSTTRLKSWFYAMYLMASTRCGISAKQLERELGVTYKTAWRMFRQIRSLLGEEIERLSGEVEVDETYIGGRRRGAKRGRPSAESHKTPVVGVAERGGSVAALVTRDVSKASVMPIIELKVMPRSLVYTDEWRAYRGLHGKGYRHRRIAHDEKASVVGNVHTNTIEGFWSILKRAIAGVYHSVSAKHLQAYINEYGFRYNHPDDPAAMFHVVGGRVRKVRRGRYGEYAPIDPYRRHNAIPDPDGAAPRGAVAASFLNRCYRLRCCVSSAGERDWQHG
jgi:transposase